jgi:hypothetical protein
MAMCYAVLADSGAANRVTHRLHFLIPDKCGIAPRSKRWHIAIRHHQEDREFSKLGRVQLAGAIA